MLPLAGASDRAGDKPLSSQMLAGPRPLLVTQTSRIGETVRRVVHNVGLQIASNLSYRCLEPLLHQHRRMRPSWSEIQLGAFDNPKRSGLEYGCPYFPPTPQSLQREAWS